MLREQEQELIEKMRERYGDGQINIARRNIYSRFRFGRINPYLLLKIIGVLNGRKNSFSGRIYK
jgi:hypothetical protein